MLLLLPQKKPTPVTSDGISLLLVVGGRIEKPKLQQNGSWSECWAI